VLMLARMLKLGLYWSAAWCLAGAFAGFVLARGNHDPRALPREFAPFVVGIPSAIIGGVAGIIFVFFAPAIESRRHASIRNLAILGAVVGGGVGVFYMKAVIHSPLSVVGGALFGAALGAATPWLDKIS
jgi:hypothetical protein